jgi:hypothetical protein
MIQALILVFFFTLATNSIAQVKLNPGVDTSSTEHKEILLFWTEYLKSKPSKSSADYLEFWNADDKRLFKQPDLTLHAINTEHSTLAMGYTTVLSILPYQKNFFEIKTAIGWSDSTGHINLLAITNHYVSKKDGRYKLYSPIKTNRSVRLIETDYYKIFTLENTTIPTDTLIKLTEFIDNIKSDYQINEDKKVIIIYGKNYKETEEILGFDFNLMSSANNPSGGISDISNNLIILNGLSPIYHETTHIFLNPLFKDSPLLEGLATFYGGSMGKSLAAGIRFLDSFISVNENINLYDKLTKGNFFINNEYNPIYILQGLLINIAFEKGGIKEVKRILSFRNFDDIFEFYFKIHDKNNIDKFLKSELKKKAEL